MTDNVHHQTIGNLKALSWSPDSRIYGRYDGEPYHNAARRWSRRAVKNSLAIVMASTPLDVATTVLFAKNNGIPVVAKCGGHSPSGASSTEGGIVIDLGLMRQVTVQPNEQWVTAGGGCLYADVSEAAAAHGLACVGGSTSHVGIGGLMLHGGYGFLTGQYGLAVDNIKRIEVVTSSGEILWADEGLHPDLFWSMRGAGSHFGIVTKFVLQAHPVSNVWGGVMVFRRDQSDAVVQAIHEWYTKKDPKASAGLAFGQGPDGKACLTLLPFYNGEEGEASFAPFIALDPVVNQTSVMPYCKINTLCDEPGLYTDDAIAFASGNLSPTNLTPEFVQTALNKLDEIHQIIPTAAKSGALALLVQPDAIQRQDPTAMAFPWRDDHFDVGIVARWSKDDDSEAIKQWHEDFQAWVVSHGSPDRLYANHSDFSLPAYEFGTNLEKLKQQKSIWDANNVFRSL